MRRAFAPRVEEDESEIDLTPMLDVVFIMLIFFIVTATFLREFGINVNNPDDDQPPPKNKDAPILVRIEESGRLWVDKNSVDMLSIRNNIERLHAERPKASVVIQAADKSKTDWLIQVMDQSRLAGVYNISIAETD